MQPHAPRFNFMWIWGVILIGIIIVSFVWDDEGAPIESEWSSVAPMIEQGEVEKINVTSDGQRIEVFLSQDAVKKYKQLNKRYESIPQEGYQLYFIHRDLKILDEDIKSAQQLRNEQLQAEYEQTLSQTADSLQSTIPAPTPYKVDVRYEENESGWGSILLNMLPWLLLIGIWFFFIRGMSRGGGGAGGIMNVGKARAQVYDKDKKAKITFKDVAGHEEAKVEIMEIVDFLKKADKYRKLGAKIPKGALLVGPPGTGKTLLAKAVAGEANVPFLSISGSDFVEMFVGVGASRVRDLFEQAKQKAPCIVFIDEIDAIGRARGKNAGFSGNDERENTLNQLLTEMDGFQTNAGVIVLAATNRVDILDKALMRAGRFDRQIDVGLPDINEREAIFEVHLRNIKLDEQIDRHFLAKQTPGFSGADIANVCNEAALIAARKDKTSVTQEDFLAAIDRIIGGLEKRNKSISAEERRATAIHEAGHATVMWMLPECDPVLKVTIIPRGKSLGATWSVPDEERVHITNTTLEQRLAGMLAGRIAEEVNYGTLGAGALNDLERSTKMTYAMVAYYGMSKKIGPISYYDSTGTRDTFTKPFSEQTAHEIDNEVRRILDEAYTKAREIVEQYNDKINAMADMLLEKETIYTEDIETILGKSAQKLKSEAKKQAEEAVVVAEDVTEQPSADAQE